MHPTQNKIPINKQAHLSTIAQKVRRIILFGFLCMSLWACTGNFPKRIQSGLQDVPDIICIKTGFTNAFLISATDGYLLIDTGYTDDYEEFLAALNEENIDIKEITHIFLTHHHDDHVGFAAQLSKESNARIIAHSEGVSRLKYGRNDASLETLNACVSTLVSAFRFFHNDEYSPLELTDRDILITQDDSSILEKMGIPGKIITTPGHTKESISIVLNNGYAFVGDAAMDLLNICMCEHRPIFVENRKKVYTSWRKLKLSGATRILPAHGDPFGIDELNVPQD